MTLLLAGVATVARAAARSRDPKRTVSRAPAQQSRREWNNPNCSEPILAHDTPHSKCSACSYPKDAIDVTDILFHV